MATIKPRDFTDIWAFVRVVETGSFSAAAKILGSTKANVSKQVARLEQSLKTRLLHRSTRQVSLTEAGSEVYQHAVRMIEEAKAIEAKVAGLQKGPSGTLRVSASMAFGNAHIAGLIPEFMERYPEVQVVLNLNDRFVDLIEEGFDVVLRLTAKMTMQSVVARPIAQLNYVVVASPDYIERYGTPDSIEALAEHRCLTFDDTNAAHSWNFSVDGKLVQAKVRSVLSINSSAALRTAMLSGTGIALLPTYVVGDDIKNGTAIRILRDVTTESPLGEHIYAVYVQNKFLPLKVRVFIDFLLEKIGDPPYWDDYDKKRVTRRRKTGR